MSELAKFFESKGLEITKIAEKYVRLKLEEVNEGVLTNTINLAKDFSIDKEKSFIHSESNQLFIFLKPEVPKPEPIVEKIPIPVIEPEIVSEALRVEIPIPEEETSEKIKDIIEDLEEIVEDLEE